ncbi:MAG TPA: GAP family protein [Candidatus Bathyarchaeia archaeon]|nr:GAP family protein [Candidatus Bathyarchaeia archaeon]
MATNLAQLLLSILPFALASMVSPLAIITVMAVLSATTQRAVKAALFTITYAAAFSSVCLLLLAIGSAATSGGTPSRLTAGIDIIAGIILLYAAGRSLRRGTASKSLNPEAMSVAAVVSMGVLFSAGNVSSLIPALVAGKDIGVAAVPPIDKAIAFAFLLIIALSWVWVPVAVYLVTPSDFDRLLDPVIRFLRQHGGQMMAAVFLLIGLYLIFRGATDFVAL